MGHFISEPDTIEFVGMFQQLRSEGCRDELGLFAQFMDHVCNSFPVLGIQGLKRDSKFVIWIE